MLTDSLARWTSEWRKLKRFLELKPDLIELVREPEVKLILDEWRDEAGTPNDAMKPKFWARLEALFPVFEMLHSIVKLSQASNVIVMSSIPWWLQQIDSGLRIRVEDEPAEVALLERAIFGAVREAVFKSEIIGQLDVAGHCLGSTFCKTSFLWCE